MRNRRMDAAFILVDILAALTVFGGGILLTVTFFHAEVRETRTMHELSAGRLLALSEIERLAAVPYDAILLGANQPLALTLPAAARLKAARGILSVREIRPGLKEATVRIVWDTPRRHHLQAELTRRYARGERP